MTISASARLVLRLLFVVGMVFIYVPLTIVVVNSFNADKTFSWPPQEWTLEWWQKMVTNQGVRDALLSSVIVAAIATLLALFLGTLVAMAIGRYSFFGRDTISLLVILPIALPGIVTGIALNTVFTSYLGGLTFMSIVIGHATFCIVVVYNNALARLRRVGTSFEEASTLFLIVARSWRFSSFFAASPTWRFKVRRFLFTTFISFASGVSSSAARARLRLRAATVSRVSSDLIFMDEVLGR